MLSASHSSHFCQLIGAGSVEPQKDRTQSGLLVVANQQPLIIDLTPSNWSHFGDWLFHPRAIFLVTHGHMDHFHPEHPWKGVYDSRYANFGTKSSDRYPVHLYAPSGVITFLLRYNGFKSEKSHKQLPTTYRQVSLNHHQLQRNNDRRTLHLHQLRINIPITTSGFKITPFNSLHSWSYPPHRPPFCVTNCASYGYIIEVNNKRYLYMPDFGADLQGKLSANIIHALDHHGPLDLFIVGCTNPNHLPTTSSHATPADIFQLYLNLKNHQLITDHTWVVFTHLNPNWQQHQFHNPGFPENRFILGENRQIVSHD
jgi:hypothetical protein